MSRPYLCRAVRGTSAASTAAGAEASIYDELIALAPDNRPARLDEAVAAIKADAGGGS